LWQDLYYCCDDNKPKRGGCMNTFFLIGIVFGLVAVMLMFVRKTVNATVNTGETSDIITNIPNRDKKGDNLILRGFLMGIGVQLSVLFTSLIMFILSVMFGVSILSLIF